VLVSHFGANGNLGAIVPADARTHFVGHILFAGGAHVTGGAGGSNNVVLANHPLFVIQVHLVDVGVERNAVFGFFVDFLLRMVGTQMTLAAGSRMAGLRGIARLLAVACRNL